MATGKKSKPSYFYAIVGISLVLFLLGTLGWILLNSRAISSNFKENFQVTVNLHDDTRPEMSARLEAILKQQPWVKAARYVSKEEGLMDMAAAEGADAALALGTNPLWPLISVNVHAEYVAPDSLAKVRRFLMQSNIVHDVDYRLDIARDLDKNFRRIGLFLGGLSILLLIAAVALIDNTVRLAMFSNRFLIKTMQMVGATRRFISRPFDRRAVVNGLLSAAVAIAGVWGVKTITEAQIPELKGVTTATEFLLLTAGVAVLGVLISLASTHRSVLKYLKVRIDDLY